MFTHISTLQGFLQGFAQRGGVAFGDGQLLVQEFGFKLFVNFLIIILLVVVFVELLVNWLANIPVRGHSSHKGGFQLAYFLLIRWKLIQTFGVHTFIEVGRDVRQTLVRSGTLHL